VQVTELAPVQVPARQVSVLVHRLLSLQTVPSFLAGFEHVPLVESQLPAVWHWSLAVQVTGLAPVQVPAWHVSLCVQALPSLQPEPSFLVGFEHVPLVASHVPAT